MVARVSKAYRILVATIYFSLRLNQKTDAIRMPWAAFAADEAASIRFVSQNFILNFFELSRISSIYGVSGKLFSMTVQCQECKNEKNVIADDLQVGRWFECDYCGTTYEIGEIAEDGTPQLRMVEEEK